LHACLRGKHYGDMLHMVILVGDCSPPGLLPPPTANRAALRPRGAAMGRHRKGRHMPQQQRCAVETVQLVDTTGTAHLVSVDAAANGLSRGWYTTICGSDVLPAAMVAREARYCRLCAPIPAQRSRAGR
jgi:hypothetical protein